MKTNQTISTLSDQDFQQWIKQTIQILFQLNKF